MKSQDGYSIIPAYEGGFYIRATLGREGEYAPIVFAGTLEKCLEFVSRRLGALESQPE